MTSSEKDELFSPRWLAATVGVAEVMRRRHDLHAQATGRDPVDEFMGDLKGLGPAELRDALRTRFQERQSARTDEENAESLKRLREVVAEGTGLGRAVYDAMNPPQEQRDPEP